MKKPYSLDYSIPTDKERVKVVEEILNNLTYYPTQNDLELFANYILNPKSSTDKPAITEDYSKRYKHWVSHDAKNESLEAILENPLAAEDQLQPMDERYIYVKKKRTVSRRTDGDIPGMKELWESIDRLQHTINVNEGKVPLDLQTPIIETSYRLYQLKHNLIDLRAVQYDLLDAYRPTIHFKALVPPKPQSVNWGSNSESWIKREEWERLIEDPRKIGRVSDRIEDYSVRFNPYTNEEEVLWVVREHTFDFENYLHVQALINYYSKIYEQLWDKPDSWGRVILFDFDRYASVARLSDLRQFILLRKIDGASSEQIAAEVLEKYGVEYSASHIGVITAHEIPIAINTVAKKQRLLAETPDWDRKYCSKCGRLLPKNTLFFGINRARKDGWMSMCKECHTEQRLHTAGGTTIDGRFKDTKMFKVQARQATE